MGTSTSSSSPTSPTTGSAAKPPGPDPSLRDIPLDWEALEDAFENNAPEVHSYLQLATGEVIRVVDGVADPQMHSRIAADTGYLRVDPVSSREQYRWMERFIPMVENTELRTRLGQAIDGKGAFRRFKDVLMAHAEERERWFTYRSERLKTFMDAWLTAHSLNAVPRPPWTPLPGDPVPPSTPGDTGATSVAIARRKSSDSLRRHLRETAEALGPRELEVLCAFAEFLRARRVLRHTEPHDPQDEAREAAGEHDEPPSSSNRTPGLGVDKP